MIAPQPILLRFLSNDPGFYGLGFKVIISQWLFLTIITNNLSSDLLERRGGSSIDKNVSFWSQSAHPSCVTLNLPS